MTCRHGLLAAAALPVALFVSPNDAAACAGAFRTVSEVSVGNVTDHRIVWKLAESETILWDQMRYSGAPSEFAWVLPVRSGAKLELSHDEFISSLEATTRSTSTIAVSPCPASGGGCGADETATFDGRGVAAPGVQVLSQEVVGPYDVRTLHATGDGGISSYLLTSGFAIPEASSAILDQYAKESFDFIAVRLRPDQGVQAMQPVRVVMPGADPTLPLRMIAVGASDKVGISLWIISEGRYRAQNFPNGLVDDKELVKKGDGTNFADLQEAVVAMNDGRTWLTEVSFKPWANGGNTGAELEEAYTKTCRTLAAGTAPCDDAGTDAGDDAGDAGDAKAPIVSPEPTPPCTKTVTACEAFDDIDVALRGLDRSSVWITRMRAALPLAALTTDLRLEAAEQTELNGAHSTAASRAMCDDDEGCTTTRSAPLGTWAVAALTAIVAASVARRRRR